MITPRLILAILLGLCGCCSALATTGEPLHKFTCSPDQRAAAVVINGSKYPSGVIETPNFPQKFPLPLDCAWVIDKSGLEQHYIHVYFTQVIYCFIIFYQMSPIREALCKSKTTCKWSLSQQWQFYCPVFRSNDTYPTLSLNSYT